MSRRKKNGDGRGKKVKGGKKIRGCKGRKKEEDIVYIGMKGNKEGEKKEGEGKEMKKECKENVK